VVQESQGAASLRQLKRVLWGLRIYPWLTLGALSSALLLVAAYAITPQLFRWAIDQGIAKNNLTVVLESGAGLVVAALARGLFNFGQSFCAEAMSQSVVYDLRNRIFSKIQTLSFSYHDQAQTSQLLTRVTNDIEQVRTFLSTSLVQVISGVVTLVAIATILLVMNWQLALISLTVVPMAGWLMARFLLATTPSFARCRSSLAT
jgi:ATP-binding cassette subfamily B multidrug efflux pump